LRIDVHVAWPGRASKRPEILTLLPALCDGRCVRKADPSCVEPLRREIPGLRRAASALRSSRSSQERSEHLTSHDGHPDGNHGVLPGRHLGNQRA
jgi:hypothetical protein